MNELTNLKSRDHEPPGHESPDHKSQENDFLVKILPDYSKGWLASDNFKAED